MNEVSVYRLEFLIDRSWHARGHASLLKLTNRSQCRDRWRSEDQKNGVDPFHGSLEWKRSGVTWSRFDLVLDRHWQSVTVLCRISCRLADFNRQLGRTRYFYGLRVWKKRFPSLCKLFTGLRAIAVNWSRWSLLASKEVVWRKRTPFHFSFSCSEANFLHALPIVMCRLAMTLKKKEDYDETPWLFYLWLLGHAQYKKVLIRLTLVFLKHTPTIRPVQYCDFVSVRYASFSRTLQGVCGGVGR